MTREDAIKLLSVLWERQAHIDKYDIDKKYMWTDGNYVEALEMAIKALEQEPKADTWSIKEVADALEKHGLLEQEPCEDCISRVAVRQALDRYIQKAQSNGTKDDLISFEELVIKSLPSVQPKTDVLDKIRAEIARVRDSWEKDNYHDEADALTTALAILDKYKAESEEV